MRATEFARSKIARNFYRLFNESGYTNDGREFHNVEILTFRGDQIRAVNVFFGATYKNGKFVKQAETP